MTLVYRLIPKSYDTFVGPGFALIPGRNPRIRMLALNKFRALILPYLQQKSAVYSPYWVSGTGRCGQDAELALAVCFGPPPQVT